MPVDVVLVIASLVDMVLVIELSIFGLPVYVVLVTATLHLSQIFALIVCAVCCCCRRPEVMEFTLEQFTVLVEFTGPDIMQVTGLDLMELRSLAGTSWRSPAS